MYPGFLVTFVKRSEKWLPVHTLFGYVLLTFWVQRIIFMTKTFIYLTVITLVGKGKGWRKSRAYRLDVDGLAHNNC